MSSSQIRILLWCQDADWPSCWLQLRVRPLTQSQAIPLVLLAPDIYVPLDPLSSQDAKLLSVHTVGDKDPINSPANASFVAVSMLLLALEKGFLSVLDQKCSFVLNLSTSRYKKNIFYIFLLLFFNGVKWKWFDPLLSVFRLALTLISAMHQHLSACLSLFNPSLCPVLAASTNRAVLAEYMESIFVSIFVSFWLYSTCKQQWTTVTPK